MLMFCGDQVGKSAQNDPADEAVSGVRKKSLRQHHGGRRINNCSKCAGTTAASRNVAL